MDKANAAGCTPLFIAAAAGNAEVAKILLDHEADVHQGPPGFSPLKVATKGKGKGKGGCGVIVDLLNSSGKL